jgi:hypothetical protein
VGGKRGTGGRRGMGGPGVVEVMAVKMEVAQAEKAAVIKAVAEAAVEEAVETVEKVGE